MYKTKEEFLNAVSEVEKNTRYIPAEVEKMRLFFRDGLWMLWYKPKDTDEECVLECRDIAAPSILARAHIAGSALGKLENDAYETVVNHCLAVNTGDIGYVTQVRDMLSAVLSDTYKYIPAYSVFKSMFEQAGTFLYGDMDDTGFWAGMEMPKQVLGAYASEYANMKPILEVRTSNTGHSAVNIVPKFVRGNRYGFVCGSPLSVLHKGEGNIEQVRAKLDTTFALFKQSIEKLEALKNIHVHDPVKTFTSIAHKIGVPKRLAALAREEFEDEFYGTTCTAYDMYLGLTTVLEYAQSGKHGNDVRFMQNLQEIVSRALQIKSWNESA